jgi:hypothetical protein
MKLGDMCTLNTCLARKRKLTVEIPSLGLAISGILIFILPTKNPSFIIYCVTNLIHIQFTQLFYLLLIDLIRLKHSIFTYTIQHDGSVV